LDNGFEFTPGSAESVPAANFVPAAAAADGLRQRVAAT
jgi:hypothetical protein